MVVGYLLLFRLDELGFEEFRSLASSIDPTKMVQLLTYLVDWKRMEGQLTQDWLTVFDLQYINEIIIGGLKRASKTIEKYCHRLASKATSLAQAQDEIKAKMGLAEVAKKDLTVPCPFNLTKPNPRRVPEPIKIEQAVHVGPSPDYMGNTSLEEVEAVKRERLEALREATVQKYRESEETGNGKFRLHETRSNISTLREEVERRMESELQFNKSFHAAVPKYPEAGAQVRLNAATIIREDALLKRKQGQDAKLIKSFEGELRDSSEFYLWQAAMRKKDTALRKEQVDHKRTYAKASQQAARDAMKMQRYNNFEIAAAIKEEKGAMTEQREAEEDLAILMNQRLVKEVAGVRETAPREAVLRLLDDKKANKIALCQEMEEARNKREREATEEAQARKESVAKLKEHEVHENHVFDPTESAGLGLLGEMSLAETKLRLRMNWRREASLEAEKRGNIIKERQEKERDLQSRQDAST
ncbi:unnamed protein product [Choristocarpus tenellus]